MVPVGRDLSASRPALAAGHSSPGVETAGK